MQITYQKRNGELVIKEGILCSSYKIGETNGFGWKVVDMKYYYKGKYYSSYEYDEIRMKNNRKEKIIRMIKSNIKRFYKDMVNIASMLLVIRFVLLSLKV